MLESMRQHAGLGLSDRTEDNMMPWVTLLQSNSPICSRENPAHVEGATAGNFWLRESDDPIVDGHDGLIFQPCASDFDFVEWIPRKKGGGIVNRTKTQPKEAVLTINAEGKSVWQMPNGNEIVDTRYLIGQVIRDDGRVEPYAWAFSSSHIGFFKRLMAKAHTYKIGTVQAPLCALAFLVKAEYRQKAGNSWYVPKLVKTMGYCPSQIYQSGLEIAKSWGAGEIKINEEQMENNEVVDNSGDDGGEKQDSQNPGAF
jgi:hypothetical protein